jgi:hypothetical protein
MRFQRIISPVTPLTMCQLPLQNLSLIPWNPTPEELQDMERQRRQELLARKKVALASRKIKPPVEANDSDPVHDGDIDLAMAPPAATELVESFLSTIGPSNQVGAIQPNCKIISHYFSQVDQPLESDQTSKTTPQIVHATDLEEIPGLGKSRPNLAVSLSPQNLDLTPPSYSDSITTSTTPVQPSPELPLNRSNRSKGARRPVAFDFVDVEERVSSPNSESSSMSRQARSSGMNFSTVTMRRCVIDLSDSEDDEGHFRSSEFSKRSQTVPNVRSQNGKNHFSSRSSPALQSAPKARSATVTPSPDPTALQIEINNLREKIGVFEEKRKRKMVRIHVYACGLMVYSYMPISLRG